MERLVHLVCQVLNARQQYPTSFCCILMDVHCTDWQMCELMNLVLGTSFGGCPAKGILVWQRLWLAEDQNLEGTLCKVSL